MIPAALCMLTFLIVPKGVTCVQESSDDRRCFGSLSRGRAALLGSVSLLLGWVLEGGINAQI